MSKQQHTPGPWSVWEADASKWEICEPPNNKRHSHFCSVEVGGFWGDEGKANARLIAAAPDLLEALENQLRSFESQHAMLLQMGAPDFVALRDQARAAIAKARGES